MENIILAIFFSSCIIVTFRLFIILKIDNLQAITFNYLAAAILSYIAYGQSFTPIDLIYKPWFGWAVINSFLFILVFFVFARSAQKAGVAVTAVASKMSVIIPVSIGIILYGDSLNIPKALGIVTAFPAFYLVFSGRQKERTDKRYWLLPLILFLGTGSNDSVMKHAQKFHVGNEYLLFLGTIFALSLVIGMIAWVSKMTGPSGKLSFRNIFAGTILGVFNFSSTLFFLKSLAIFESSVFFPVFNVSVVSMGALIGWLIFREKLLPANWLGIFLAILTILFIAIA